MTKTKIKQLLKQEADSIHTKMRKLLELDSLHAQKLYQVLSDRYIDISNFNLIRITPNKRIYTLSFTIGGFDTIIKKGKIKAFARKWALSSVGTFEHLLKEIYDGYIDDIITASEPTKSFEIDVIKINESFNALGLKLESDGVKDE